MMMVWPDRIKKAKVVHQNVSSMDVLPTALVAAGAELPDNIDGKDLLPMIGNPKQTLHEELCWTGIYAPAWGYSGKKNFGECAEGTRSLDWRLGDCGRRLYSALHRHALSGTGTGLPGRARGIFFLHNISDDQLEQNNLMKAKPEVAERMKVSYMKFADTLPAPYRFRYDAWAELVPNPGQHPSRKK